MGRAWMDAQFALAVYQAFLTLLVWVLAAFACFGFLASVLLLCLEYSRSNWVSQRVERTLG
jgi:hypothetical protein